MPPRLMTPARVYSSLVGAGWTQKNSYQGKKLEEFFYGSRSASS